jgi:hypothetical protein
MGILMLVGTCLYVRLQNFAGQTDTSCTYGTVLTRMYVAIDSLLIHHENTTQNTKHKN